jgi:hypothetical protein
VSSTSLSITGSLLIRPPSRSGVVLIRRDGVVKPWPRDAAKPRYRLTYLELDGREYWSMRDSVPETTVINRAVLRQAEIAV